MMPENVMVLSWKCEDVYLFSGPEFEFGAFFLQISDWSKIESQN